jgi:hypothetical protein
MVNLSHNVSGIVRAHDVGSPIAFLFTVRLSSALSMFTTAQSSNGVPAPFV